MEIDKNLNFQVVHSKTSKDCVEVYSFGERVGIMLMTAIPRTPKEICGSLGVSPTTTGKMRFRESYKEFYEKYKITPSNAIKVIRGVVFGTILKPIEDLIDRYAFQVNHTINPIALLKIFQAEDKIRQAQKDGIDNIVPFIYHYNKSPQELKKEFGKSLWKKLCKNSHHRNKVIIDTLKTGRREVHTPVLKKYYREDIPTGKLRMILGLRAQEEIFYGEGYADSAIKFIEKVTCKSLKGLPYSILLDLVEEADLLNISLIPRMFKNSEDYCRYHASLHRHVHVKRNEMRYSKEPFQILEGIPRKFEANSITATLLTSPYEILEEGSTMRHCVAGYSDMVARGIYLVYHLSSDKEDATLGIMRSGGMWKYNQMYLSCNRQVTDGRLKMMSETIIYELNKEKLNEQSVSGIRFTSPAQEHLQVPELRLY